MKSISICPSCKAVLEFDRALIRVVKCPKCNYRGNVENFKEKEPATEVPDDSSAGKLYKPGKLELLESDAEWLQEGKTVDLKPGVNTLGRMSSNSTANTQLPVADPFISRNHASVEVVMKTGGVFEHHLSDMENSKNGAFHNGERLEKGDVIKLIPGDIIKLGHTSFKFIPE